MEKRKAFSRSQSHRKVTAATKEFRVNTVLQTAFRWCNRVLKSVESCLLNEWNVSDSSSRSTTLRTCTREAASRTVTISRQEFLAWIAESLAYDSDQTSKLNVADNIRVKLQSTRFELMTELNRVSTNEPSRSGAKGGNLLEKPVEIERYDDRGSAADLLARIRADLLPAQREFIDDTSHRIVGYIGGFGSGKSYALAAKAITLGLLNPGTTAMNCGAKLPHDSHGIHPCDGFGVRAMGH